MVKLWKNIKPHTLKSRQKMLQKYGSSCFLEPKTLKYPLCNKYTGKKECMGHRAAQYYLNINLGKQNKKKNKKDKRKTNTYKKLLKKTKRFTKKYCR